jgi:hypothetical protein
MKHLQLDHLCLVIAIAFGAVSATALVREAVQSASGGGPAASAHVQAKSTAAPKRTGTT